MRVLGTGLKGLIGSRIVDLLKDKIDFEYSDIDITNKDEILEKIRSSDSSYVLHLAAKTHVDSCEEDKGQGIEGDAWKINVTGTENVVEACKVSNKKIIYISTDFVFDGENAPYKEEDLTNPLNWYAETKKKGEDLVLSSGIQYLILRIAYPYRAQFSEKKDFMRAIIHKLKSGEEIMAIEDHIMTPTFVDDIAFAIEKLIQKDEKGIFHVVGDEWISPYEAALEIANTFDFDKNLIKKTTRAQYFKEKAARPFNLSLMNDKIERLGVGMKSFKEGLHEVLKQIQDDKKI